LPKEIVLTNGDITLLVSMADRQAVLVVVAAAARDDGGGVAA
jgi:hypothetical protein